MLNTKQAPGINLGTEEVMPDDRAKTFLNKMKLEFGEEKTEEMKNYATFIRGRHPRMGPKQVMKKVLQHFKIKLIP